MRVDDALENRFTTFWIAELVLELSEFRDGLQIYIKIPVSVGSLFVCVGTVPTHVCVSLGSVDFVVKGAWIVLAGLDSGKIRQIESKSLSYDQTS